jgi:hypothetical protein
MAGRGSLAGLLAYGNANEIVCEMAHEVLPVVKHTPVLAGVNGTDPFMIADEFLQRLIGLGFSGVQNFPTVGLIDGTFRANLEETGMGYGLEVEMIARAHALDLLTTPYVFNEDDAAAMTAAGADIVVCHMGLTTGGAIGAETALTLADCVAPIERAGGGEARASTRGDRALPWRPDRHARGRRSSSSRMPVVPRLLRRQLDGAPAHRGRADRDDAALHPNFRRQTMTGAQFGSFLLGLIVVAIVVAIAVWLLHWLYLRSSKERSFVRTGLGGQKVVLDGGAFVLPIVHDVIPVNMNTLRLEVTRGRDKALITKDRMRVDVIAEFYVRVAARPTRWPRGADAGPAHDGARAAEGTGRRQVRRRAAHGRRRDDDGGAAREARRLRQRVRETVAEDLTKNGLELESVSLTQLDQTGMEFFNPSNAFDAEGLTRLTETDRAAQEAAQRRRAGHADRDPQQEPRGREALARDRPRGRVRAAQPAARGRDRARPPAFRADDRTGPARGGGRERADRRQADHRRGPHPLRADDRAGTDRQGARRSSRPRSIAA